MLVDGQILQVPIKQLSIIAPTKRDVHGKLQKDMKVQWRRAIAALACTDYVEPRPTKVDIGILSRLALAEGNEAWGPGCKANS